MTLHKLRLQVKNYLGIPKLDAEVLKLIASKIADGATSLESICHIKATVFHSMDRTELQSSDYLTGRQIREILSRMQPEIAPEGDSKPKPTMHPVKYPQSRQYQTSTSKKVANKLSRNNNPPTKKLSKPVNTEQVPSMNQFFSHYFALALDCRFFRIENVF